VDTRVSSLSLSLTASFSPPRGHRPARTSPAMPPHSSPRRRPKNCLYLLCALVLPRHPAATGPLPLQRALINSAHHPSQNTPSPQGARINPPCRAPSGPLPPARFCPPEIALPWFIPWSVRVPIEMQLSPLPVLRPSLKEEPCPPSSPHKLELVLAASAALLLITKCETAAIPSGAKLASASATGCWTVGVEDRLAPCFPLPRL
jgi:hypothetical protein